jgi:hypothetical protein
MRDQAWSRWHFQENSLKPSDGIESLETLIAEYPCKDIDQPLRLRELQILYRSVAESLDGAIKIFE